MKIVKVIIFSILVLSTVNAQVTGDIIHHDQQTESFVTVQGISFSTIGHFNDAWKDGSGGYIGYGNIYSNHWALLFHTGYISFNPNEEMNYTGDASFSILPLMVGTRYYLALDTFRPFLLANGGINIVSQKYALDDETVDKTSSHVHFQVGAGISIRVISNLEIELQGKYNSHLLEPSVPYNITGLEYGIALNWVLH